MTISQANPIQHRCVSLTAKKMNFGLVYWKKDGQNYMADMPEWKAVYHALQAIT